jgi:hypothetical protein
VASVGDGFRAPGAGGGEGLELAGLDVREYRLRGRAKRRSIWPARTSVRAWPGAFVGDVKQVDLRYGSKQLGGEVRGGAGAGRAEGEYERRASLILSGSPLYPFTARYKNGRLTSIR